MGKHVSGAFVEDQRKKPFAAVSVDLIDRFGPLIGKGHGLAVYLILARYASNKTHEALLWNRTIAKKIGVSKTTVKRAIDLLIQYDLVKFCSGQSDGQANRYILRDLPAMKTRGTTPLFDREDEIGGSQVNHLTPSEKRVNQPSITCEPESSRWTAGEPGVDHGRSRGSSPAVQGWSKNEGGGSSKTIGGVAQICDRNKGTSRLVQSTRETNPQDQTENQNLGADLHQVEYARKLLEELELPESGKIQLVADSIKAFSASQGTLFAAYQEMRARAFEARNRGAPIKWHLWFLNGEYNQSQARSTSDERRTTSSAASERMERVRESLVRAAIAHHSE